jgi:hypothetical protein
MGCQRAGRNTNTGFNLSFASRRATSRIAAPPATIDPMRERQGLHAVISAGGELIQVRVVNA